MATSCMEPRSSTTATCQSAHADQLTSAAEVSGYLVGSPAFKAGGRGDPTTAGSIPVHLRHLLEPARIARVTRHAQAAWLPGQLEVAMHRTPRGGVQA